MWCTGQFEEEEEEAHSCFNVFSHQQLKTSEDIRHHEQR